MCFFSFFTFFHFHPSDDGFSVMLTNKKSIGGQSS